MWIVRVALTAAVHVRRARAADPAARSAHDRAHADRHLPEHQHPGRHRRLELRRPLGARRWPTGSSRTSSATLTTTVNDIEHIESQSLRGIAVVKVFFQPGAKIDLAVAQVTAVSQSLLRQLPPGTQPPFIITYNASTRSGAAARAVGQRLSEQQLFDLGVNFLRTQLATVQGAAMPLAVRRQAAADPGRSRSRPRCRRKRCRRPTSSTRSARRT